MLLCRQEAYSNPNRGTLSGYLERRSFSFCETCGVPGETWGKRLTPMVACCASASLLPSAALSLCPNCAANTMPEDIQHKAEWLELNLTRGQLLFVTGAAIVKEGMVLLFQKATGEWEFPGGKLLPGENLPEGLKREIAEELNLAVEPIEPFGLVDHDYGAIKLRLFGMRCSARDLGAMQLSEHTDFKWVGIAAITDLALPLSAADVKLAQMLVTREVGGGN